MYDAYLWSCGTYVLYIGCMVFICGVAVRLSYIYIYIGYMVPIWGLRYVCPIYKMHGAYLGITVRLSYI